MPVSGINPRAERYLKTTNAYVMANVLELVAGRGGAIEYELPAILPGQTAERFRSLSEAEDRLFELGIKSRRVIRSDMTRGQLAALNHLGGQDLIYFSGIIDQLQDAVNEMHPGKTAQVVIESYEPTVHNTQSILERYSIGDEMVGFPIRDDTTSIPTIQIVDSSGRIERTLDTQETLDILRERGGLRIDSTLDEVKYGKLAKRLKALLHVRGHGFNKVSETPFKVGVFDPVELVPHARQAFKAHYLEMGFKESDAIQMANDAAKRIGDGVSVVSYDVLDEAVEQMTSEAKALNKEIAEATARGQTTRGLERTRDSIQAHIDELTGGMRKGDPLTGQVRIMGLDVRALSGSDELTSFVGGLPDSLQIKGTQMAAPQTVIRHMLESYFGGGLTSRTHTRWGRSDLKSLNVVTSMENIKTEAGLAGRRFFSLDYFPRFRAPRLNVGILSQHPWLFPKEQIIGFAKQMENEFVNSVRQGVLPEGFLKELRAQADMSPDTIALENNPETRKALLRQRNYARKIVDAIDDGTFGKNPALMQSAFEQWRRQFERFGRRGELLPAMPVPNAVNGYLISHRSILQTDPNAYAANIKPGEIAYYGKRLVMHEDDIKFYHALQGYDDDDLADALVRYDPKRDKFHAIVYRPNSGESEIALFEIRDRKNPIFDNALRHRADGREILKQKDMLRREIKIAEERIIRLRRNASDYLTEAQAMHDQILEETADGSSTIAKQAHDLFGERMQQHDRALDEIANLQSLVEEYRGSIDDLEERAMAILKSMQLDIGTIPGMMGFEKVDPNGATMDDVFKYIGVETREAQQAGSSITKNIPGWDPRISGLTTVEDAANTGRLLGDENLIRTSWDLWQNANLKGQLGSNINARYMLGYMLNSLNSSDEAWAQLGLYLDRTGFKFGGDVGIIARETIIDALTQGSGIGDLAPKTTRELLYGMGYAVGKGRFGLGLPEEQAARIGFDEYLMRYRLHGLMIGRERAEDVLLEGLREGAGREDILLRDTYTRGYVSDFMMTIADQFKATDAAFSEIIAKETHFAPELIKTHYFTDEERLAKGLIDVYNESRLANRAGMPIATSADEMTRLLERGVINLNAWDAVHADMMRYLMTVTNDTDPRKVYRILGASAQIIDTQGNRGASMLGLHGAMEADNIAHLFSIAQRRAKWEAMSVNMRDRLRREDIHEFLHIRNSLDAEFDRAAILDELNMTDSVIGGAMPRSRVEAMAAEALDEMTGTTPGRAAARAGQNVWEDFSMETVRRLGKEPMVRRGAAAAAGLALFGMIWNQFKNRDRSPEDMQGPALLPGGSAYEGYDMIPPALSEGGSYYDMITPQEQGMTYMVNARGDFDVQNLMAQIEGVTGSPVSGTINSAPPLSSSSSDYLDRVQGNF